MPRTIDHIYAGFKYRIPPCCIANFIWDFLIERIKPSCSTVVSRSKRGTVRLDISFKRNSDCWVPCRICQLLDPRAITDEQDTENLERYNEENP